MDLASQSLAYSKYPYLAVTVPLRLQTLPRTTCYMWKKPRGKAQHATSGDREHSVSQTGNSWARTKGAPCRRAPGGGPFDSKASSAPERAPSVAGPVTPRHSVASPTWARPVIGQLPVAIRPPVLYIAWKHQFGVETRLTRLDSPPPRPSPRRALPTRPSFPRTTLPLTGELGGI